MGIKSAVLPRYGHDTYHVIAGWGQPFAAILREPAPIIILRYILFHLAGCTLEYRQSQLSGDPDDGDTLLTTDRPLYKLLHFLDFVFHDL